MCQDRSIVGSETIKNQEIEEFCKKKKPLADKELSD